MYLCVFVGACANWNVGLPIPIVGVRSIVRTSRHIVTAIVSRGTDQM